jgi:hypothetical protein
LVETYGEMGIYLYVVIMKQCPTYLSDRVVPEAAK